MNLRLRMPALFALLFITQFLHAQAGDKSALRSRIREIAKASGAKVGVAAMRLDGALPDSLMLDGSMRLPMQSVYKLPLALAVLQQVHAGKLSMTQEFLIRRNELDSATWSPMYEAHPEEAFNISLSELLRYTVSQSDNNACDVLFRIIGGPGTVQKYLSAIGIRDIRVLSTEHEMHRNPKLQYQNWSTPAAMMELLRRVEGGSLLSAELMSFLNLALVSTQNSPKRIGGELPAVKFVFAHKTGSSGTNADGLSAAVNDAGILRYRQRSLGIVVFVSDLQDDTEAGEKLIARISREIWDYYMADQK